MVDPLFWLSLSALTLTASVAVFLALLVPAIQELNRTARSAEKLLDTLNRELPPTLDALKATSAKLSGLTEDLGDGVKSAKQIVQQVDRSLGATEKQVTQVRIASQSAIAGIQVAWRTFFRSPIEPASFSSPLSPEPDPAPDAMTHDAENSIRDSENHADGETRNDASILAGNSNAGNSKDGVKQAIADEISKINQTLSEM